MKRFDKMSQICERLGYVAIDSMDGVTKICGLNRDRKCDAEECPSLHYWRGDKQIGWHEGRSLEQTGLTEQFVEEMEDDRSEWSNND